MALKPCSPPTFFVVSGVVGGLGRLAGAPEGRRLSSALSTAR